MTERIRNMRRRSRIWWVTAFVIFLTLGALILWVFVRTHAKDGYGSDRFENYLEEGSTAMEGQTEEVPAVLLPSYPSPFRPRPDTEESETVPLTESDAEGQEPSFDREPDEVGGETAPLSEIGMETASDTEAEEIVYHSRKNDRMEIALSFDDGPHPRLTPVILKILAEYGIKATFFMVGENVGYYPDAARAVAEAGHEIGNHTFSHRRFNRMTEGEMRAEIASCEEAISGVWSHPVHYVRTPEGQMNDTVRRVAGNLDYRIILWDVDTRDWAHTPPEAITRHVLDTVQAGDIILMHDFIGHDSPTPEALRRLIPALLERGYRFVTVGELVEGTGAERTDGGEEE